MVRLVFNQKSRYFSRELSWLSFNDRVLEEAADLGTPLFERIKYLGIFSSNLEEFFRVRLAGLIRRQKVAEKHPGELALRDGVEISELLKSIRTRATEQKSRQALVWDQIFMELGKIGIIIEQKPTPAGKKIFEEKILPLLQPINLKKKSDIPLLQGGQIHFLAVRGKKYSIIPFPEELPRFFVEENRHIHLVDTLMATNTDTLFPGESVDEIFAFKLSRDARMDLNEEYDDFIEALEEGLRHRKDGDIVRLEVDSPSATPGVHWLQKKLKVSDESLYQVSLPLDLKSLIPLSSLRGYNKHRYSFPAPRRSKALRSGLQPYAFFRAIENQDQLLHHPYTSYGCIADFVRHAAEDPKVIRVCQTLYRSSTDSSTLEALRQAAKKGKKVLVLVEAKARFDEKNNLKWARALEKAGATVILGTSDFKVHAKVTYIERLGKKPGDPNRHYVHVGTGNYHPGTAKFYTDLGILSSSSTYWRDAKKLFDLFESMHERDAFEELANPEKFSKQFKSWSVSPQQLRDRVIESIQKETEIARSGKPAFIKAKMNGLVEKSVIEALYEASQAGVQIDLIVRGMCCLRPGVVGLSENIRVRSIIDKYLEHSRLYAFGNGGRPKVWISSADWMPRNLFRRVEVAVPIRDPKIANYLLKTYWAIYESDNLKARECLPDGRYIRDFNLERNQIRAQFEFEKMPLPTFKS